MKRDFLLMYHSWRLAWNWSKCRRMLENTGMAHSSLFYSNWAYAKASINYNESKDFLEREGQYISAKSQMKAFQEISVG